MTQQWIPALVSLFVLGACAQSQSDSIASSEVYAIYTLSQSASGTVTCDATLTVGGAVGTYIELSSSDSITCKVGSDSTALSEKSAGSYSASGVGLTVGGLYTVDFKRDGGKCGGPETLSSSVVMPATLSVTSPTANASHDLATAYVITWTASDADSVSVSLTGQKVTSASDSTPTSASFFKSGTDSGTLSIAASELAGWLAGSATLTVTRAKSGSHASGLKGGSIQARSVQTIAVTLTGTSPAPSSFYEETELLNGVYSQRHKALASNLDFGITLKPDCKQM